MPTLTMLKGLPASGKSTWAIEEVKKNPVGTIRINNDDLRMSFNGGVFNKTMESVVTTIRNRCVYDALSKGLHVIVDNTNFNPLHEETYRGIAKETGSKFVLKEFRTDVETCVERDRKRANPVGEEVIRKMSDENNWGKPEPKFSPIVQDSGLVDKVFIFDIDGTLARISPERDVYDYTKVHLDTVIISVARLAAVLSDYHNIVFVSGRNEQCRAETTEWIKQNVNYGPRCNEPELYMRKADDRRSDDIVKREILEELVKKYYILGSFDDRDRVVKMWRESGIQCYQCNYGNF